MVLMKEEVPSKKDKIIFDEKSFYDQSDRAKMVLDHVLGGSLEEEVAKINDTRRKVRVSDALHAEPLITVDSHRVKSRVLFVTSDASVLEKDSSIEKHYKELAVLFNEVHVMVLIPHSGAEEAIRKGENIWFYKVFAKHWWHLPIVAQWAANDRLTFNGSVRPDVIVATDPYEAGLCCVLYCTEF